MGFWSTLARFFFCSYDTFTQREKPDCWVIDVCANDDDDCFISPYSWITLMGHGVYCFILHLLVLFFLFFVGGGGGDSGESVYSKMFVNWNSCFLLDALISIFLASVSVLSRMQLWHVPNKRTDSIDNGNPCVLESQLKCNYRLKSRGVRATVYIA